MDYTFILFQLPLKQEKNVSFKNSEILTPLPKANFTQPKIPVLSLIDASLFGSVKKLSQHSVCTETLHAVWKFSLRPQCERPPVVFHQQLRCE